MIPFPLRMAWREIQATWRHFLYFFICIAIGVGAIVGISLFSLMLEETVTREARALHGGDLEVRLNRSISQSGGQVLASLSERGIAATHVSELVAMAAIPRMDRTKNTQLVELKAVEDSYPLYGTFELEPSRPVSELLAIQKSPCLKEPCHQAHTALVQESLLIQMGISLGDQLTIGQARFTISGLIRKEPDRVANPFNLGPRVIISQAGLLAAELIKPGSRVRERYLLKLPPEVPLYPLVYELRGKLGQESARITTYRDAQPRLKRFIDQLGKYLGLIGLTTLLIGGIGVATTVHAFIQEKLPTIAILKTVGADSFLIVKIYLFQAILLGLFGCGLGVLLGIGIQQNLPSLMTGFLDSTLVESLSRPPFLSTSTLGAMVKGVGLGMGITLLFAGWPLLSVREVRPALIFRQEGQARFIDQQGESEGWRMINMTVLRRWIDFQDPLRWGMGGAMLLALAGLAIWQSGSFSLGLIYMAGLLAAVCALSVATLGCVWLLKRISTPSSLALRQGIRNIYRPGTHASGVMISLGMGVMVMLTISILEGSLLKHIGENRQDDSPTFFFIDIQPDQRDGFVQLIQDQTNGTSPELTPLIRSRLFAVNGIEVNHQVSPEQEIHNQRDGRKHWYRTREYVLTFLENLPKDNVVTQGVWWGAASNPETPFVSVEEEAARHLDLAVGSRVDLDIQGTILRAEVRNIRKVDWGNMSTNFFMILSPGSLDGAPITYVATSHVLPAQEVSLQQAVVRAFPNVTAINIGDVLKTFAGILDRLSMAIRSIAIFCIIAGMLVMAAALAATRYQRLYESVVLKAIGATRGLIVRAFVVEYAILGAVAGCIGVVLANVLSWGVLYFIFDLPWFFRSSAMGTGLVVTIGLSVSIGFLCTFRLLGQRPLSVLRQE